MPEDFEERLTSALRAREPRRVEIEGARQAAVLIPIVAVPEPTLLLTIRTQSLPSHKGQISFPGGSIDPSDDSPEAAAVREANEEIGLDPGVVRVLGKLDATPTFVSGFVVNPVVGWIDEAPELLLNPAEVVEVLDVPIDELTEDIRSEPGFEHRGQSYPTEAWVWRDHVIWGVTARLLRLFLYRLAAAGLAPAPADTTSPWPEPSGTRR